jgi:hypothetical protein
VYAGLYFLQAGWPAWAASAAGALFFLFARRLPAPADESAVYWIGIASFAACVSVLLIGRRIERTLELLNWVLVACILGAFLVLAAIFVPPATWLAAAAGFAGIDAERGRLALLPAGADFFLLAALVAYSGAGGMFNLTLSNWARDKGYGMSQHAGYIPAAVGGKKVNLAHSGFRFEPDAAALERWSGWWRIVRVDQWGVFFGGALLGMGLPALLYVTFLEPGRDIQGPGISAALAEGVGASAGPLAAGAIAFLGAWVLVKSQLDCMEGMVRSITDILWTGSRRIRAWRGGDVRAIYYGVLGAVVLWGVFALRLAQPIALLKVSANIASLVLILASLHLLRINTRLLPPELRPPFWRRACLVAMALFYAFFSAQSLRGLG